MNAYSSLVIPSCMRDKFSLENIAVSLCVDVGDKTVRQRTAFIEAPTMIGLWSKYYSHIH